MTNNSDQKEAMEMVLGIPPNFWKVIFNGDWEKEISVKVGIKSTLTLKFIKSATTDCYYMILTYGSIREEFDADESGKNLFVKLNEVIDHHTQYDWKQLKNGLKRELETV